MIQRLKTIILSSFAAGFMLVSAVPVVTFAQIDQNLCAGANLTTSPDASCADDTTATDKVDQIIKLVINIFSLVVGVVSVIMIIIGGLKYITSTAQAVAHE